MSFVNEVTVSCRSRCALLAVVLLLMPPRGSASSPKWKRQQVADAGLHNLWGFEGKAYDLAPWLAHHPGGARVLQNTQGQDITRFVRSHHFGKNAVRHLASFEVRGVPWPADKDGFVFTNSTYTQLTDAVYRQHDYDELKEPTWGYVAVRTAVVGGFVATAVAALHVRSAPAAWAAHALLGYLAAMVGGFGHNGLHLYARRPLETQLMTILGTLNPYQWMETHLWHHMDTNTETDPECVVTPPPSSLCDRARANTAHCPPSLHPPALALPAPTTPYAARAASTAGPVLCALCSRRLAQRLSVSSRRGSTPCTPSRRPSQAGSTTAPRCARSPPT
jgi:hypothetical protein